MLGIAGRKSPFQTRRSVTAHRSIPQRVQEEEGVKVPHSEEYSNKTLAAVNHFPNPRGVWRGSSRCPPGFSWCKRASVPTTGIPNALSRICVGHIVRRAQAHLRNLLRSATPKQLHAKGYRG